MSYGDYVDRLSDLYFLKMADARAKPLYNPISQKHRESISGAVVVHEMHSNSSLK
jgi:hypothetical protein